MIVAKFTEQVDADCEKLAKEAQVVRDIREAFKNRNLNLKKERRECVRRMVQDFRYLLTL